MAYFAKYADLTHARDTVIRHLIHRMDFQLAGVAAQDAVKMRGLKTYCLVASFKGVALTRRLILLARIQVTAVGRIGRYQARAVKIP